MGLSQYTINIVSVLLLLLYHALLLLLLRRDTLRRSGENPSGRFWFLGILAIILLDTPFFVLQVLYKEWHPQFVDIVWGAIWLPWLFLQINTLLYGTWRLLRLLSQHTQHVWKRMRSKKKTVPARASEPPRRTFIRSAALALGGVAASTTLLRGANDDEDLVVERVKLEIPGLPESFRGLRIGMISDVHSNQFMTRERMEKFAQGLSKLDADLIVLPGDFVHNRVTQVYPFAEAFSSLSAPMGVYGVTGNHDYYAGDVDRVVREIEEAGIKMLVNENIELKRGADSIKLLGVDEAAANHVKEYLRDGETRRGTIENMVAGLKPDDTSILLCHKPYPFEEYAELGVDLMLSGHTHGGQIVLSSALRPKISIASLASTYISGHYRAHSNRNAQMYISRGIGTTGIPLRVNCPPEITHIMLV